jgi:3-deoxy-D-manno-octulosonate 8-phosphate phosphatase KdsC-like HAD superfamily phosphatase
MSLWVTFSVVDGQFGIQLQYYSNIECKVITAKISKLMSSHWKSISLELFGCMVRNVTIDVVLP